MIICLEDLTQHAFRLQLDDGTVILAHYYRDTNDWEFDRDTDHTKETGEESTKVKLTDEQRQEVMKLIKESTYKHIEEICK